MDAFLAIIVASFIIIMMQNFFNLNLTNAQEFGVESGVRTEAIRIGSLMNNFFAVHVSDTDYLILESKIPLFSETLDADIWKSQGDTSVTIRVAYKGTIYTASYPVIAQISYDPDTRKVTA